MYKCVWPEAYSKRHVTKRFVGKLGLRQSRWLSRFLLSIWMAWNSKYMYRVMGMACKFPYFYMQMILLKNQLSYKAEYMSYICTDNDRSPRYPQQAIVSSFFVKVTNRSFFGGSATEIAGIYRIKYHRQMTTTCIIYTMAVTVQCHVHAEYYYTLIILFKKCELPDEYRKSMCFNMIS